MSNLVTISILQSLVIPCLSFFLCSIIHQYRIVSHNELKFVTHIFQIFHWVDAHLNYGLCKLGLFWFWKIVPKSSPHKQLIQVIPNWEIRYNLSLNYFDLYVSTFWVKFWSLKMETSRAISLLLDTVNHWFLISMVTELYLK